MMDELIRTEMKKLKLNMKTKHQDFLFIKKEKMKRSWWISCLILFHSLSMAVTLKRDQAKPGPPSFPFEKGNGIPSAKE